MKGSKHYKQGGMEPIEYIQANELGFAEGNVIKYISRYKYSGNPIGDLDKAAHYIEMLKKRKEKNLKNFMDLSQVVFDIGRLEVDETDTMFKKGDKVRYVGKNEMFRPNREFIIRSVIYNMGDKVLYTMEGYFGVYFSRSELELIKEKTSDLNLSDVPFKFKKGDFVTFANLSSLNGQKGIVIDVLPFTTLKTYRVKIENDLIIDVAESQLKHSFSEEKWTEEEAWNQFQDDINLVFNDFKEGRIVESDIEDWFEEQKKLYKLERR